MDEKNLAQVFVKIKDYKEILDIIDIIKKKTSDAKATLRRIHELKDEEDQEIGEWSKNLDDISQKVEFIDRALFEPDID